MALMALGVDSPPATKPQRLQVLKGLILDYKRSGTEVVLIIDEAHRLEGAVLEEIRLLSNLEIPEGKLLQIILAGQNELDHLLNCHEFRHIRQRIAVRLQIRPLSGSEIARYISHRWSVAGGAGHTGFDAAAIRQIGACSKGIPRIVNAICDNALMLAFGEMSHEIREEHILEVAKDLNFSSSVVPPALVRPAPLVSKMSSSLLGQQTEEVCQADFLRGITPVQEPDSDTLPLKQSWLVRFACKFGLAS
jgi:AAA domain